MTWITETVGQVLVEMDEKIVRGEYLHQQARDERIRQDRRKIDEDKCHAAMGLAQNNTDKQTTTEGLTLNSKWLPNSNTYRDQKS